MKVLIPSLPPGAEEVRASEVFLVGKETHEAPLPRGEQDQELWQLLLPAMVPQGHLSWSPSRESLPSLFYRGGGRGTGGKWLGEE